MEISQKAINITLMIMGLGKIEASAVGVRVAPFGVFILLTSLQGSLGVTSPYWLYAAKTLAGGWLLWAWRKNISEMQWRWSWAALAVGVGVFIMWVGLDDFVRWLGFKDSYPTLDDMFRWAGLKGAQVGAPQARVEWNPPAVFGANSQLAWFFIIVRILGATLVVPPLEEVFYRSFLYRYIARANFESIPLGQFLWVPFLVTSLLFGSTHFEWLAAILCGFAYQGLVCWKKRLGDAMTAHAITNFLLGAWVVWRSEWHFW